VGAGRPPQEPRYQAPPAEPRFAESRSSESRSSEIRSGESRSAEPSAAAAAAPAPYQEGAESSTQPEENRPSQSFSEPRGERGFRGRRRRGRRGDRGLPESKFARPAGEASQEQPHERPGRERPNYDRPAYDRPGSESRSGHERHSGREERSSYGPPPGYQPIILPGESISKYRKSGQSAAPEARVEPSLHTQIPEEQAPPIAETFPEDEPMFIGDDEGRVEEREELHPASETIEEESSRSESHKEDQPGSPWDAEHQLEHQRNVAAIFGGSETVAEAGEQIEQEEEEATEDETTEEARSTAVVESPAPALQRAASGTVEEEEIEDDEADLSAYVEELEEDAAFEEMEEETHAAGEFQIPAHEAPAHEVEIAASGEAVVEGARAFSAEPVSGEEADIAQASEADEEAEAEAEVEEAQAEAEALLDAEGRESGTVDARAEVRAPSATAAYTQRAQRPAFDRRGQRGRRGGSGSGGRRFRRRENHQLPQISDLLKEGQEILVQIAKEPIGKKGARITSHIALPGRFLVFMPTVNHTGVSRKIASEEERQRLKRIILSERENGHGGFIVRTAAQNASEDELRADIRFLKGLWNEIKSRAESSKPPALIYHDLNVVERVLRDQVTSDFSVIWVDTEAEYERTLRFFQRFQPALVKRVKLYSKETPLFEQFGLNEEINKALKSKVWLKSGGYIVINQTEALVAIDVNTGKYVGKTTRLEDTIVKTNVDAIREIVRQVRLRDLGGIIVIDFIDMDERRNRQKVMQALEEALRADRAPSKALQFNDFGLVAITRKRVKQSLERTIGAPCPYCASTGFVKSVGTVCNEIYVEMRKISKHLEHSDVMLRVNPEVAKALKGNNGKALLELEELTKKTVIVKSDPALHQEQFDIN